MTKTTQEERIKQELQAVGVTSYGLLKSEARHLHEFIHPDEHIGGAVYGQIAGGDSAFLIATDRRVIFYDSKPLYSTFDELTYDVVAGIKANKAGLQAGIVLHTRVTDYSLRFVNPNCARIFTRYVEKRRLEQETAGSKASTAPVPSEPLSETQTNESGLPFLRKHELGVLSTVDRTGNIHGAVVYYTVDQNDFVYILTKAGTSKGRNVYSHSQVALTIHEPGTMQTLQLEGQAEVETNQQTKEKVFARIVKPRTYDGKEQLPPVTKLHEGAFMVIKIIPTTLKYHDYAKAD